jgi:hypothetical protein
MQSKPARAANAMASREFSPERVQRMVAPRCAIKWRDGVAPFADRANAINGSVSRRIGLFIVLFFNLHNEYTHYSLFLSTSEREKDEKPAW